MQPSPCLNIFRSLQNYSKNHFSAGQQSYDIIIVGGGIVGAATLYRLQEKYQNLKILLLEKENELAHHQTGNNSGVIHSGLYYQPNSYRAKNCVKGRKQLVDFSKKYGVKHDVCGKIVVATNLSEIPFLEKIYQNGVQNETEGIEFIDSNKISEIEPYVKGIKGIWVPCTGIIDFKGATNKMVEIGTQLSSGNSTFMLNQEVQDVKNISSTETIIKTQNQEFKTKYAIFCCGLQSDLMAKKAKLEFKEKIVGIRGDYYFLTEEAKHKVKNLVYPVPNPKFPFLGVHFTRMTSGHVECGPNAVFSFKREGYKKTDFSFTDTFDALSYSGTWKLLFNNFGFTINEFRRAFSKQLFLKSLQKLIPDLKIEDLGEERAGVRAMYVNQKGDTKEDFKIQTIHNTIHVINAPSPAATAALAIGEQIVEIAEERFLLKN